MAFFDEAIPPGQAGKLRAVMKTEHYRGSIAKGVSITTNDPDQGSVYVTIRAEITGSVTLLPSPSLLVNAGMGEAAPVRLLVRKDPTEQGILVLSKVTTDLPWLEAKARRIEKSESVVDLPPAEPGDWIVEVALHGEVDDARGGQVSFSTGLPREPVVKVPVRVFALPVLQLHTSEVVLSPPPGVADSAQGTVFARLRPGVTFMAVSASVAPPLFQATVEDGGAGRVRVNVSWKAQERESPTAGTLTLRVGTKEFMLPVRVDLTRPAPPPTPAKSASGS